MEVTKVLPSGSVVKGGGRNGNLVVSNSANHVIHGKRIARMEGSRFILSPKSAHCPQQLENLCDRLLFPQQKQNSCQLLDSKKTMFQGQHRNGFVSKSALKRLDGLRVNSLWDLN